MSRDDTFETTYPRYDFAPLVEIGIRAGNAFVRLVAAIRREGQSTTADAGLGHSA